MDKHNRNKFIVTDHYRVIIHHCDQNGRGLEKVSVMIFGLPEEEGAAKPFVGSEEVSIPTCFESSTPYADSARACLDKLLKRLTLDASAKDEIKSSLEGLC